MAHVAFARRVPTNWRLASGPIVIVFLRARPSAASQQPQGPEGTARGRFYGRSSVGYAADSSIGLRIEGSSFSGLLTRVEVGHIRIGSAGNGRIKSMRVGLIA